MLLPKPAVFTFNSATETTELVDMDTLSHILSASFEAVLVVAVLERVRALKIHKTLLLELVERIEEDLAFLLPFLSVTKVKVTSPAISILGNSVGMRLGP